MKRFLLFLIAIFAFLSASAQSKQQLELADNYLKLYADYAVTEMQRSGVPASITLAQGMLESNYGRSELTTKANNHFGIQCGKYWKGKRVEHMDNGELRQFRKYKSALESYEDHSNFLIINNRYRSLFELEITDYKGWAYGLKKAGYAEDPAYAEKLIKIIEMYDLDKYDVVAGEAVEKKDGAEQTEAAQETVQKDEEKVEKQSEEKADKKDRKSDKSDKKADKKSDKKDKKKKKDAAKAKKKADKAAGKAKPKKPLSDTIDMIRDLVAVAVLRFAKHLRIRVARLHIAVGTGDAASTAILYGAIAPTVACIAAYLDSTSTLRHPTKTDVDIHADYLSEKMQIDIKIGFSICVWQLFDILFRTGFRLTKHL